MPEASVTALALRHHGTSLGYVVREPAGTTIDMAAVKALGLEPGQWLAALKDPEARTVVISGTKHDTAALWDKVTSTAAEDSIAYMTDFRADKAERGRLAPLLSAGYRFGVLARLHLLARRIEFGVVLLARRISAATRLA